MPTRDIIQPSKSPWASPTVVVRKKDGSARFCIDYRRLNSVTHKDAYPFSRIDDTLDTLAGSQWFSTLDLLSGYWQVEVAESDRTKTAFITQEGLFEFKVMQFGLYNAPATFQRLMNLVLAGVQRSECLVYLDDIIVLGKSYEDHLQNLGIVLCKLHCANLRLKLPKCAFCKKESVRRKSHIWDTEYPGREYLQTQQRLLTGQHQLPCKKSSSSWASRHTIVNLSRILPPFHDLCSGEECCICVMVHAQVRD